MSSVLQHGLGFLCEPALARLLAPLLAAVGLDTFAAVHVFAVAVAFSGAMNVLWPLSTEPAKRRRIFPLKMGDC